MAYKTKIFYLDKGATAPTGLDEFLSGYREDAISDVDVVTLENGKVLFVVTYKDNTFSLTGSSPPNEFKNARISSVVHLTFDERLSTDLTAVLNQLELYRDGSAVTLTTSDLTVINNRLKIANFINATTGAYYQLVIKSGLPALTSGRTLGNDIVITFKTSTGTEIPS